MIVYDPDTKSFAESQEGPKFDRPRTPMYVVGSPKGLDTPGTIDIANRPIVKNPDGTISTVRSATVGFDDLTYVLPTVIGNKNCSYTTGD